MRTFWMAGMVGMVALTLVVGCRSGDDAGDAGKAASGGSAAEDDRLETVDLADVLGPVDAEQTVQDPLESGADGPGRVPQSAAGGRERRGAVSGDRDSAGGPSAISSGCRLRGLVALGALAARRCAGRGRPGSGGGEFSADGGVRARGVRPTGGVGGPFPAFAAGGVI